MKQTQGEFEKERCARKIIQTAEEIVGKEMTFKHVCGLYNEICMDLTAMQRQRHEMFGGKNIDRRKAFDKIAQKIYQKEVVGLARILLKKESA